MQPVEHQPNAKEPERQRHPLARGIELLTVLIDSDQRTFGVRELASQLEVSPSTAHRLIGDLLLLGLLAKTETGNYELGSEFLRLAWTTTQKYPWHEIATTFLHELSDQSGESSFFALYNESRKQMMFSATVESSHPLRYVVPTGTWQPLHAGASGLSILAYLPLTIQDSVAHGTLEAQTDRTIVDQAALLTRLEQIRNTGFAITHGERIQGAIAIASPVFGPTGVLGSMGISIPESRFNAAQSSALSNLVIEMSQSLTDQLGGHVSIP